jgi:uncharacterized metal-binding protein
MHGFQHTAINTATTLVLAGGLTLAGYPQTGSALGVGLLFGTLLVTPDLDLQLNDARRRWGPLKFIWAPYAALSRHRGMSHTYLLGATIRLLYLALWGLAPAYVLWQLMGPDLPRTTWPLLALAVIGYYLAQWLHLLCDGILPFTPQRSARRRAK